MLNADIHFMETAITLAQDAAEKGEIPVGSVLVKDSQVLSASGNSPISNDDPSAHAEINVLRAAGKLIGNYRLVETCLYTTLEPCVMCAGAILNARVKRVVFGAYDMKSGACGSVLNVFENRKLNHHTEVVGGLMASECAELLKIFFKERR